MTIPDYDRNSPKDILLCEAEAVRSDIEKLQHAASMMGLQGMADKLERIKNMQRKVWHKIAFKCEVKA